MWDTVNMNHFLKEEFSAYCKPYPNTTEVHFVTEHFTSDKKT